MQEMIEVKRTWFGKKAARATVPVAQFTEQVVYRLRDELTNFVNGMNAADRDTMITKSWRHFICRDTFLNVDQLSSHVPILILPETHFWIVDEDHMRVWVDERVFRAYIKEFYPGNIDDRDISEGLNNAYDDSYNDEGDFQVLFQSFTLIIKRKEMPEVTVEEAIQPEPESVPKVTPVDGDALETAITDVLDEYYKQREEPTYKVMAYIRKMAISTALDGRMTDHAVQAKKDADGVLTTSTVLQIRRYDALFTIEVEFRYAADKITITLPSGYKHNESFDDLINADPKTPKGISELSHADCKNVVMRKYFPTDSFECEYNRYATGSGISTKWVIELIAIKGKE